MKKYLLILQLAFLAIFFVSCDGKFTSTVVVKNLSQAEKDNYDDEITELMVSEGTSEEYKTVWNGTLKYNQKVSYDIDSGKYCIKVKGTRSYTSGIEKTIEGTCGKGNPIEFKNCDSILFVWDGTSLVNKGDADQD